MNISISLEFRVRGFGTSIKSRGPNFTSESSLCLKALTHLVIRDFSKKTKRKGQMFQNIL